MESWEALGKCVGRDTVKHAKALGRSTALINKWTEPSTDFSDSGALNPVDRIETMIETALSLGNVSRHDALAPLQYLALRFGCTLIDLPPSLPHLKDLTDKINQASKEFGHFISANCEALEDGRITPDERTTIDSEGMHLMQAVGSVLKLVEEACKR